MILPKGTKIEGCRYCGDDIFQSDDGRWATVAYPVEDAYRCGLGGENTHRPDVPLFSLDPFTLPNGRQTFFKIECENFGSSEWKALARLAVEILPPFSVVEGVPRGGIAFADALERYVTPGVSRLLIADDVWVSGKSMKKHRGYRHDAIGIVAFTRGVLESWVKTLFNMENLAEQATYNLNKPYGVIDG